MKCKERLQAAPLCTGLASPEEAPHRVQRLLVAQTVWLQSDIPSVEGSGGLKLAKQVAEVWHLEADASWRGWIGWWDGPGCPSSLRNQHPRCWRKAEWWIRFVSLSKKHQSPPSQRNWWKVWGRSLTVASGIQHPLKAPARSWRGSWRMSTRPVFQENSRSGFTSTGFCQGSFALCSSMNYPFPPSQMWIGESSATWGDC